MAEDPLFHVIDTYYFEVPKSVWRYDEETVKQEIPDWLKATAPEASASEWKHAMDGKILIPQPFGQPGSLYPHGEYDSGFCISKFMILELVAAVLVAGTFIWLGRKVRSGGVPRGRCWNLLEALVFFVRDYIAKPGIGEKDADKFAPLLWTLFFFILACNLLGMIPFLGTPTAGLGVTAPLALVVFVTVVGAGIYTHGFFGFLANLVPSMGLPWYMFPLVVFIWVIEVFTLLIRHGVLAIRLLANMVAGHLVLFGILSIITTVAAASHVVWSATTLTVILGATAFSLLELGVAFLQAFVFTFLSALFIGSSIHHH